LDHQNNYVEDLSMMSNML